MAALFHQKRLPNVVVIQPFCYWNEVYRIQLRNVRVPDELRADSET
jgi:hypothetical protein